MSGNLADVAQSAWIASLEARIDVLFAWVASILAFIWGVMVVIWNAFIAWASPIITFLWGIYNNWIKPVLSELYDVYKTWIKPTLDWLNTTVTWLKTTVLAIQGKIETLWNDLYTKTFGWLEDLRKDIAKITSTVIDVVAIFNKELADSIKAQEDKFFKFLDSFSRDIRDEFLNNLHDFTRPIIQKISEVEVNLKEITSYATKAGNLLNKILETTFQKPQTLRREILQTTSLHWGMDLWDDLFSGVAGPGEIPIVPDRPTIDLPALLEEQITEMLKEDKGKWADAYKNSQEEIYEAVTGKRLEHRTQVIVDTTAITQEDIDAVLRKGVPPRG